MPDTQAGQAASLWLQAAWPYVLSAGTGGLAGQAFNWWVSRRRDRRELATTVVHEFLKRHGEVGDVLGLLIDVGLTSSPPLTPAEVNRVLALGDWVDLSLLLAQKKWADLAMLKDTGFIEQAKRFQGAVRAVAQKDPRLDRAWLAWEHLRAL
jgi:hypothetical protein